MIIRGWLTSRKAPTTVNDGEIAVASNEELHAAPLSAKRLLALWNALPGRSRGRRDARSLEASVPAVRPADGHSPANYWLR